MLPPAVFPPVEADEEVVFVKQPEFVLDIVIVFFVFLITHVAVAPAVITTFVHVFEFCVHPEGTVSVTEYVPTGRVKESLPVPPDVVIANEPPPLFAVKLNVPSPPTVVFVT